MQVKYPPNSLSILFSIQKGITLSSNSLLY